MTRLLVQKRGTRDGTPTGCTGATMEDGTVYRANRSGHMEVERQDHVAAMLANSDGFIVRDSGVAFKAKGVECNRCGFSGYRFHLDAPCPKCAGEMVDRSKTEPKEAN